MRSHWVGLAVFGLSEDVWLRLRCLAWFTSAEVLYGVTGTGVTGLPECGVLP